MGALIEPKVLKGFRDFLPDREAARLSLVRRLEQVFRSYGFAPIDTPVLEYAEVLLGKGGGETDKQVYRFTDNGGRDVAMRYDLTVPFARFMATHLGEIALPFKRWHAAKVWRGENTQRGRYREFIQVDFDTVGTDSASADLEILLLMRESFLSLGLGGVKVHYAHRGVFNAFLSRLGLAGQSVEVLRAIDKERKIGPEKTREILAEIAGRGNADRILAYARVEDSAALTRAKLAEAAGPDTPGVKRLGEIVAALEDLGVAGTFVLDPSITRGLDYYTGIVFETFLDRLPGIGSVCSGGRYDDLASLYTSQRLPGVGASIGLDRLMAAMEELGEAGQATAGPSVLVLMLEEGLLAEYHRIVFAFRDAGIPAEVYPEPRKLAVQFAYAEKRGIPLAVIAGSDERAKGVMNLKDLRSRESFDGLSLEDATARASALLR
jgi:histidyl-tRNA synthetase